MTEQQGRKTLRILIAGGGTGGHLFPGLSIAEELSARRECDIRFVGTVRGIESRVIPKTPFRLYTLPVSGLYRVGLKKKIRTLLKLPLAFFRSLWILLSFQPHLVIGIGGYASGPLLALAVLLRRRTVIQEQNAYPGMTNRILGRYVKLAFIPFDQSGHLFKHPVVVGNPIRKAIYDAAKTDDDRDDSLFTITVVGGSQGARILNKTVVAMLPLMESIASDIQFIHQTGKSDFEEVQAAYRNHPRIRSTVSVFIDDMGDLYRKSHLLICRAGSMINEIIAMGRASILVPITVSSGNHQRENAMTMMAAHAAVMIEETDLSAEILFETINRLVSSPETLKEMEKNAEKMYRGNAAETIVKTMLDTFKL